MDLKDFVSQSLIQIVQGVVSASSVISDLGGAVSPAYTSKEGESLGHTNDANRQPVQGVQFDVAVVASSESSTEAGGGLRVSVISLGAKGAERDSSQTTSRICFTVPLALPVDPKSLDAAKGLAEETDRKVRAKNQGAAGSNPRSWMA